MLMTLQEIKEKTVEALKASCRNVMPSSSDALNIKVQALKRCGLDTHAGPGIFDLRKIRVQSMGFVHLKPSEMVKLLMGESHNRSKKAGCRQTCEWCYNHHTDTVLTPPEAWTGRSTDYISRIGWMPLFRRQFWRLRLGKLNYLKVELPHNLVNTINRLKERKLFNAFKVLAPIASWSPGAKANIHTMVVGSVWEMPFNRNGECNESGDSEHFYLAHW